MGWYCNVTRSALFSDGEIAYLYLALVLLVYPDGHRLVLDEDEFAELELDEETRQQALARLVHYRYYLPRRVISLDCQAPVVKNWSIITR